MESNEEKVRFVLWEEMKNEATDVNPSRTVWGLEDRPRRLGQSGMSTLVGAQETSKWRRLERRV